MTTKTFCRWCRAYSVADEALLEHHKGCVSCQITGRCDLGFRLRVLVMADQERMAANCPGGDCGVPA